MENLIVWYNKYKYFSNRLYESNEYKEIIRLTSFLPNNVKFRQRIWHIVNNIFELQKCQICGKEVKWRNTDNRYLIYCCDKCKSEYQLTSEFKEKQKFTNLELYGVENYAQSKEYANKLKEISVEKYGVENVMQLTEIKQQRLNNNIKLYGVGHYVQTKESKENVTKNSIEKFKQRLIDDGFYKLGYKFVSHNGKSKTFNIYEIFCPCCNTNFLIDTNLYWHRASRYESSIICTNCNPINKFWSVKEKEVLNFIRTFYTGLIIENDRKILKNCGKNNHPLELDIYIPELNLAIEFNGDRVHMNPKIFKSDDISPITKETASKIWERDLLKKELCKKKGIELITIWELDWKNNQNIIKNKLKTLYGN